MQQKFKKVRMLVSILALIVVLFTLAGSSLPVAAASKEPPKDSLKILIISNSFGDDTCAYLCRILSDGGVKNVLAANLYIGNCNIRTHWSNASGNIPNYVYRKWTKEGGLVNKEKSTIAEALADENWDLVAMATSQDDYTSGAYKRKQTLDSTDNLIAFVQANTEAGTPIVWNETWAYNLEVTAREAMFDTVFQGTVETIVPNKKFDIIMSPGKAIRECLTFISPNEIYRDDMHLGEVGQYVAGMTWAYTLGYSIDNVTSSNLYVSNHMEQIVAAIKRVTTVSDGDFWKPSTLSTTGSVSTTTTVISNTTTTTVTLSDGSTTVVGTTPSTNNGMDSVNQGEVSEEGNPLLWGIIVAVVVVVVGGGVAGGFILRMKRRQK